MKNEKIKPKMCELCKEIATCICFDCSFYLCDSCNKFLHEKKKNLEHKKEYIDPFFSYDIKCPKHPKIPMNLFNSKEKSNIFIYILLFYL